MLGIAMPAAQRRALTRLLPALALAAALITPCAQAKKDLFGSEPGAKHAQAAEQLAPTRSATPPDHHPETSTAALPTPAPDLALKKAAVTTEPSAANVAQHATNAEPQATETQFARLKRHITKTKNDVFGGAEQKTAAAPTAASASAATALAATTTDIPTEAAPAPSAALPNISATEAAQRAQTFAEGQVINVRLYQVSNPESHPAGDQARYAVKLLQKNGRMKTINLDAATGALIEETPQ